MSILSNKVLFLFGLILFVGNLLFIPISLKFDLINYDFYQNLKNFVINFDLTSNDNAQIYNLQLSTQDSRKLRSWKLLSTSKDVDKKSFRANLCLSNRCSKVRVTSKGDLQRHWNSKRKSYRLRIEDHSFLAADEVDFTIANDRYFENELLAFKLAKKIGMPILPSEFSLLSINNSYKTLYLKSLRYTKINLEKYLKEYSHIVKLKNIWLPHLDQSNIGTFYYSYKDNKFFYNHWRNFDQLYSIEPERKMEDVSLRWENALECIRNMCNAMGEFFDLEHFSQWLSIVSLFGSYHATIGDNLLFIYNSSTKKFSPIINDVLIYKVEDYEDWLTGLSKGNDFIKNYLRQKNARLILSQAIKKLVSLNPLAIREQILKKNKNNFIYTNVNEAMIERYITLREKIIKSNLLRLKDL